MSVGDIAVDQEYRQVQMETLDVVQEETGGARTGPAEDDAQWHENATAFREWLSSHDEKLPSRRARKGSLEKRLAVWWIHQARNAQSESRRSVYEELRQRTGRPTTVIVAPAVPATRTRVDVGCARSPRA